MEDLNEPSSNPSNYKFGIFYYNPKDSRSVVPKLHPMMGWTLNFARPWAYIFLFLVFGFVGYKLCRAWKVF